MFRKFAFSYCYIKSCQNLGGNELHNIIRQDNPHKLYDFIKEQDIRKLNIFSTQVDNKGKIPFSVLNEAISITTDDDLSGIIFSTIFSLTVSRKLPSLTYLLELPSNQLDINLQVSIFALNEARRVIKNSHTQKLVNSNNSSNDKYSISESFKAIKKIREQASKKATTKKEYFELLANMSCEEGVGNCLEYSLVVCKIFRERKFPVTCEVFIIVNGDHVFNVIGRNPNTDKDNFYNWNDDVVIIDAWSCEIYSKDELEKKLKDFKRLEYGSSCKYILTNFNSKFHKFDILFEQHPEYLAKSLKK